MLVPPGRVSLGLLLWSQPAGAISIIGVLSLSICGFWVTAAHNAAHHQELEGLAAASTRYPAARECEFARSP